MKDGGKNVDPEVIVLATKAEWMMNGGRSSYEWDELSNSDVKLLTVYYAARDEMKYNRQVNATREGVYAKSKRTERDRV